MIKFSIKPFGKLMEFDHMTNRYLYPDRYIKMIPYFLIIPISKNQSLTKTTNCTTDRSVFTDNIINQFTITPCAFLTEIVIKLKYYTFLIFSAISWTGSCLITPIVNRKNGKKVGAKNPWKYMYKRFPLVVESMKRQHSLRIPKQLLFNAIYENDKSSV
jgi:hypothetical protein